MAWSPSAYTVTCFVRIGARRSQHFDQWFELGIDRAVAVDGLPGVPAAPTEKLLELMISMDTK